MAGKAMTVIKQIGDGGQGRSYLVVSNDVQHHKQLVYKIFDNPVIAGDRELREIEYLQGVDHPYMAKATSLLAWKDRTYGIVYEYIEGVTLGDWCATHPAGPQKALALRSIALKLLSVLQALEAAGVVHRDVKPANIIIDPSGEPYLIDFGMIVRVDSSYTYVAGTRGYMSPQHVFGREKPNWRWDVYGLCISILECLVEVKHFPDFELDLEPHQIDGLDDVSSRLSSRMIKELEVEPRDRHPSIGELVEAVRNISDQPFVDGAEIHLGWVADLLRHTLGGHGVLAVDSPFARKTKVSTRLEERLLPRILAGEFRIVFLCGNPGDGKTTFIKSNLLDALTPVGSTPDYVDSERRAGWTVRHGDRLFKAIYDGSESVGSMSNDDRIREALQFAVSQPGHTSIIAINDGRLVGFLTKFSDEFSFADDVIARLRGAKPVRSEIALIDLKARSQVAREFEEGLAIRNLKTFIDSPEWSECDKCVARVECPIRQNAMTLRESSVQVAISQLLEVSHLRRRKRVTFREVRSMMARLITGGIDCNQVHAERGEGLNPSRRPNRLVHDLLFCGSVDSEPILREIAQLDPSRLALVELNRAGFANQDLQENDIEIEFKRSTLARQLALGLLEARYPDVDTRQAMPYRYLDEFRMMLRKPDEASRNRLLLGISRIVAAPGYEGGGLAVRSGRDRSEWTLLRVVPEDCFTLASVADDSEFVETYADYVNLQFAGPRPSEISEYVRSLRVTVDVAEVILRAADGQMFDDVVSDGIIEEIRAFALSAASGNTLEMLVTSPSGMMTRAKLTNNQVELSKV